MKTQREALHPGKERGSADRPIRSLKFLSVDLTQPSSGRCRAIVELDRPSGEPCVGVAEGAGATDLERFRTVAQATASAILLAVGGENTLTLEGVTVVEALGKRTVFVSVRASYAGQNSVLLGFCLIEGEASRAAALAVLNATNRFLSVG